MRFSDGLEGFVSFSSGNRRNNIQGDLGNLNLFPHMGDLGQNLIGEHTIFRAVFQEGQHMSYYGVSHWSVARDESGEIGP